MAVPTIVNNKFGSKVTLHTTATASANIVGNSSTCDIALVNPVSGVTETISAAHIRQVWWGCANGTNWTVTRGANNVLVLNNSGKMQFSDMGSAMSEFQAAANIVFTLVGTGAAFCRVELQKISNGDVSIGA